jgi:hypothetical protein
MENLSNYLIVNNELKKKSFSDPVQVFHYHDINKFLVFENGQERYIDIINNVISDYENNSILSNFKEYIKDPGKKQYIIIEYKANTPLIKMVNSDITLISVGGYGQIYKISDDVCLKINLEKEDHYHEFEIPKHLSRIANETMKELILFPYSIIKHCKFMGLINILQINIFFIYFIYCIVNKIKPTEKEIEKKLNSYNIKEEYKQLFKTTNEKALEKAVDLYNFFCVTYLTHEEHINILKYMPRLVSMFKDKHGNIKENGFMILMPLLKSNSIALRINKETKKIDNINGVKACQVYKHFYRMLFLQMSILLLNINNTTNFTHNDFKADNVLVDDANPPYELKYKKNIFKFNEYFIFKLADFDFSLLQEYTTNSKLTDKELFKETTWLTDIHFFIHSLFFFISGDEYKSDKLFFNKLHEYFIKPYCNITIDKLLSGESNIKKKDSKIYCNSGRLINHERLNISYLHDFITSNLFKEWM